MQRARTCAAHDAHLAYASGQRALRRFELQHHAAGNFLMPNQLFDFRARHSIQHFFAVQHAGHVGQINQPLGLAIFRAAAAM